MKSKKVLDDYLTFSKKDRIGATIVMLILSFIFLSPKLFNKRNHTQSSNNDTAWIQSLKKIEIKQDNADSLKEDDDAASNYQYDRSKSSDVNTPQAELFYFDPNTTSITDWEKLGLKNKTIQTIQNYLSKGGHFKQPEDLKKVYGLRNEDYERLAPFIRIKEKADAFQTKSTENKYVAGKKVYAIVDINSADTSAFIALPGIGNKLAARILSFREKLGGFYSIEQIGETYGLPDSTFQKIKQYLKLENSNIKKININTATVDELKAHPYIKYSLANPIVAYRNQHGPFAKVEDIKKVMVITDDIYDKISAYLTVQ